MGATHSDVYIERKGRVFKRMTFAQRAELRKYYVAQIPRWRHPLIGYVVNIPLVGLAMYLTLSLQELLGGSVYFPGTILALAVMLIALFWGVGPSLVAVALCTLLIDFYFVAPSGQIRVPTWQDIIHLLPFVLVGITIAIITAQRESARLKTLAAEQELQNYAQELETINQKLEDVNQTKDRFLSIASHELKTPITTIRGQAQLALRRLSKLKEPFPEQDGVQQTLVRINEQTNRLTSLVDELLDVSSMRTGKVELRKRYCDLRDICRDVVEDQHLLTGRSIALDLPSTPVKLYVDYDRMAQVMVNLVSNAVKYSPERSPVEVCVRQQKDTAAIEVKDHGKGVARDQLERIFETFYRTPEAEASSKKGLGLGLAISKEIIERHEGRIWCESEQGQGSTFFVELPLK